MAFTPFVETDLPSMANFNEKFLQAIREGKEQALSEGVKMEVGSYVGTGVYGVDNPNSLTFGFVPKIVFIGKASAPARLEFGVNAVMIFPWTSALQFEVNTDAFVSRIENGISWYGTNAEGQANVSGNTYHYLAIG